jgi:serine/threonine protein kinase, bacterial
MEGTPFGRYRLIELLGRGGMGEVWRAYDSETDRIVALKVLPAHLSEDEEFQRRFRREAHAAARLNSPHVIPIHHYGEIEGRLYLDMRLIEGRDLASVLVDGPLEPTRAVQIVGQVAKALHAAHQVGLLHRDIKPSNILLDRDDFAYLIDFGIARTLGETRMTQTGGAIGTFQYIAPERLTIGTDEDARADIYSLACVLYEALTGSPPFPGDTTPQLVAAHLNAPPPRPSASQPLVPAPVDEVIAKGMAKEPNQRYATTIELADAARDAITVPLQRPTAPPTRVRATEPASGPTLLDDATRPASQQRPPGWPPVPQPRPADRRPPATPPRQPWWRRRAIVIPAALLTVAVITAAIVITSRQQENSNGPHSTPPTSTQHREPTYGPQVTLPFTGLTASGGVAVDGAGDLYVVDGGNNNRVLELAAGSSTQSFRLFTGLAVPWGVAVDAAGNLYVTDAGNNQVLKLAGLGTTTVLPFSGLSYPAGVAVDGAGNVYVADSGNARVLKLAAAGSSSQLVLPFSGLAVPRGVAVDAAGDLYVTDFANGRVLKLAAGSPTPTVLPFTGLKQPVAVAVDAAGNVYVADISNNQVVKLAAGSSTQVVLPFTGLAGPWGVAVDSTGTVYVADTGNNRVLKLPVLQ